MYVFIYRLCMDSSTSGGFIRNSMQQAACNIHTHTHTHTCIYRVCKYDVSARVSWASHHRITCMSCMYVMSVQCTMHASSFDASCLRVDRSLDRIRAKIGKAITLWNKPVHMLRLLHIIFSVKQSLFW
mgnify:CR=1 FL=1